MKAPTAGADRNRENTLCTRGGQGEKARKSRANDARVRTHPVLAITSAIDLAEPKCDAASRHWRGTLKTTFMKRTILVAGAVLISFGLGIAVGGYGIGFRSGVKPDAAFSSSISATAKVSPGPAQKTLALPATSSLASVLQEPNSYRMLGDLTTYATPFRPANCRKFTSNCRAFPETKSGPGHDHHRRALGRSGPRGCARLAQKNQEHSEHGIRQRPGQCRVFVPRRARPGRCFQPRPENVRKPAIL